MGFFNKDSQMVKSALLLFSVGIYTEISEVPNVFKGSCSRRIKKITINNYTKGWIISSLKY